VQTAETINDCSHESHSLLPKKVGRDKVKTWPGGMSLVPEATTLKGVKLIAVGYKYNSSKVLCFITAKIQDQHYLESPTKHGLLSRPVN
jgi:hypothetical protein